MAARALFAFVLTIFFVSGAQSVTFKIENKCPFTIWPASLGTPQLSVTGFELGQGQSRTVDAPKPWTGGRFWARTQCTKNAEGKLNCQTGNCGSGEVECKGTGGAPPVTLAEFTLQTNEQDFYDVSLVDGFNLPAAITAQGGTGKCASSTCKVDVNKACPAELQQKGPDGNVIACKSACVAFGDPKYCCTGNFNKPETCPPTNYSMIFEQQCPEAYSYAYDDKNSTFTCTNAEYIITFCP